MSSHTPAPWLAEADPNKKRHDGRTEIHQANRGDAYSLVAIVDKPRDVPVITAAPAMLAMLKKNEAFIHDQFGVSEDLIELRTLIARAEGVR